MNARLRIALFLLLPGRAWLAASEPESRLSDNDLRIEGVLASALPGTEPARAWRLIVHPRLGDLVRGEHLRTALGLRHGLTARWEAVVEIDWFFSHGLQTRPLLARKGLSSLHAGTKYRLGPFGGGPWEGSIGADLPRPSTIHRGDHRRAAARLTLCHVLARAAGPDRLAGLLGRFPRFHRGVSHPRGEAEKRIPRRQIYRVRGAVANERPSGLHPGGRLPPGVRRAGQRHRGGAASRRRLATAEPVNLRVQRSLARGGGAATFAWAGRYGRRREREVKR